MPRFDRNTVRRGRSAVPATFPRTRRCRRSRSWRDVATVMLSYRRRSRLSAPAGRWRGSGGTGRFPQRNQMWSGRRSCSLAHLPSHVLALVADALALVRLGRADLADLGCDQTDLLLVD